MSNPTPFNRPADDAVELLQNFSLAAMRCRRQWCGFKIVPQPDGAKPQKLPVVATEPGKNASSTDPDTWSTFDEAVSGLASGAYTAVGYALDGDVVGVDLDGDRWIDDDGKLTPAAQALVERCASYSEWSISGKGVHILLDGKLPGDGRRSNSAGVEIYTTKRFFIVTGKHLDGTPETIIENQPAVDHLMNTFFDTQGESTECTEPTEVIISVLSVNSVDSVDSVLSVDEILLKTQPTKQRERNGCIFNLARGLKFDAGMSDADYPSLKPIVRRWYDLAFEVIGSKNFDETWSDFIRAWPKVTTPLHAKVVAWARGKAETELPPQAADYDSKPVQLLVGMCFHLAFQHPNRRFFIGARDAGDMIGVANMTTRKTPQDNQKQLDALKELQLMYLLAMLNRPKCFKHVSSDKMDDGGLGETERRIASAYREADDKIEAAKKKLLATGYESPESWLTVCAVGGVGYKWGVSPPTGKRRRTGKEEFLTTVTCPGPDKISLKKVCDEMYVAGMRLEAKIQQGIDADAPDMATLQKAVPVDAPIDVVPPLSALEVAILRTLSRTEMVLKRARLSKELSATDKDAPNSENTIRKAIARLRGLSLTHCPQGERNGEAITPKGRVWLSRINAG